MLFGRSEELAHIYNMIDTDVGIIFVQGQKRVGKTSLFYHLKKYYLGRRFILPVFIDFQLLSNLSGAAFYFEVANAVYNDLQNDNRISNVGPPLRELFEDTPVLQLTHYLRDIQEHPGFNKLVLLIDEFSRIIDAYRQGAVDNTFFDQWRGLIQATAPDVNYIMVVQQQTYKHLSKQPNQSVIAPIWHLLELGETIILTPLLEEYARQLIERPTYNHLDYSPEVIRYVWQLTGGRPFFNSSILFHKEEDKTIGNFITSLI